MFTVNIQNQFRRSFIFFSRTGCSLVFIVTTLREVEGAIDRYAKMQFFQWTQSTVVFLLLLKIRFNGSNLIIASPRLYSFQWWWRRKKKRNSSFNATWEFIIKILIEYNNLMMSVLKCLRQNILQWMMMKLSAKNGTMQKWLRARAHCKHS